AIMMRQAEHLRGFGEQDKIDSPGVDAHGNNLVAETLRGGGQAVLDFQPQARRVPVKTFADFDGLVGEAADLFEPHAAALPRAGHDAAAFRPEIRREKNFFAHTSEFLLFRRIIWDLDVVFKSTHLPFTIYD